MSEWIGYTAEVNDDDRERMRDYERQLSETLGQMVNIETENPKDLGERLARLVGFVSGARELGWEAEVTLSLKLRKP